MPALLYLELTQEGTPEIREELNQSIETAMSIRPRPPSAVMSVEAGRFVSQYNFIEMSKILRQRYYDTLP